MECLVQFVDGGSSSVGGQFYSWTDVKILADVSVDAAHRQT